MGIAAPNQLTASNLVRGFSKLLQFKSLQDDIFAPLGEIYNTKTKEIPNAIYLTVNDIQSTAHDANLPMLMPLFGAPTYGNIQSQVGREENQVTKFVRIFKNDYSHAITNQLFGIDAQDKRYYNLLEQETAQLGFYFKELYGLWIRQALLERFSENLTNASPTNTATAREFTPNWYIKNIADTAQPAFSQVLATHTNNIVTALNLAGTTTAAVIDTHYLAALERFASYEAKITPLHIGGQPTYIVTVPTNQAVFLKDPTNAGSFGATWIQYNRLTEEEMNYPNVLGRYGVLLLIEDPRAPTILPGGSAAPFSLTTGYLFPGENDQRSTSPNARDLGFLIGRAALIKWETEGLHYEIEDALTYRKFRGRGAFGTAGVQQTQYDVDTNQNATSREQFSSIALAFARVGIVS